MSATLRLARLLLLALGLAAVISTMAAPVFATRVMAAPAAPCHPVSAAGMAVAERAAMPGGERSSLAPHPCCALICLLAAPAAPGVSIRAPHRLAFWDPRPTVPLAGLATPLPDPPPRAAS